VFATHFHELTALPDSKGAAFCLSVGIVERGSEITFTHRIEERPGDRSYGIEVARLAGLPESLVKRAAQLLEITEHPSKEVLTNLKELAPQQLVDDRLTPVVERLDKLVPNQMTPIQALAELAHLKELTKMK
jgi:DNA mismatch repair protein MutS